MSDEARELRPYVVIEPGAGYPGDFGAYPMPSDWPEPDPKTATPVAKEFPEDLIPEPQETTPIPSSSVSVDDDLKQALAWNPNLGSPSPPAEISQ